MISQDGATVQTGRAKLLRAARHLFQARGYHAVGVSEILSAAALPKGSLYHHFPGGKAELASAVIAEMAMVMAESFARAQASGLPAAAHLARLCSDAGTWLSETDWREGAILAVMSVGIAPDDPVIAPALIAARRRVVKAYTRYLDSQGIAGAERLGLTILAALDGAFLAARIAQDVAPLHDCARVFAPILAPPEA